MPNDTYYCASFKQNLRGLINIAHSDSRLNVNHFRFRIDLAAGLGLDAAHFYATALLAPMPDRDLKLNSLPRHSKTSSQFILEEHGHCEVPAGCGGVVLRWRNPNDGIPLQIWPYAAGKFEMFLDGVTPSSGRPVVPWGRHVWSFAISEINPERAALMCAAIYDEKVARIKTTGPSVEPVAIVSKPDGTWKYTISEPPDSKWMTLDYDDSSWLALLPKEIDPAALERTNRDSYRIRKLQGLGAEPLGVVESGTKFWIRKAFSLEANKPSP